MQNNTKLKQDILDKLDHLHAEAVSNVVAFRKNLKDIEGRMEKYEKSMLTHKGLNGDFKDEDIFELVLLEEYTETIQDTIEAFTRVDFEPYVKLGIEADSFVSEVIDRISSSYGDDEDTKYYIINSVLDELLIGKML